MFCRPFGADIAFFISFPKQNKTKMDRRKPLLVMLNICPYRRGKAKSSYATRRVPTFSRSNSI
jgi:hypothetical protein